MYIYDMKNKEDLTISQLKINKEWFDLLGQITYMCVVNEEMRFAYQSTENAVTEQYGAMLTYAPHVTEEEFIDMAKDVYINEYKPNKLIKCKN
jgi:hypothetical protein